MVQDQVTKLSKMTVLLFSVAILIPAEFPLMGELI